MNRVFHHFNDGDSNHARRFIDVIGPIFPIMHLIPSRTTRLFGDLKKAAGTIALELIKNSEKERDGSGGNKDHSILGMLGELRVCLCFFLFAPDYYLWRISQGTNRRCIFQVVASRSGLSGGLISAVTQSCDDLTKFRLYVITGFF